MTVLCPVCRARVAWHGNPYRPFCGDRCKIVDLGNWADESYRVAGDPIAEDGGEGGDAGEPTRH